ncbi:hypothetical protein MNBD_GAMMA02-687 [hydrothermal vent metagenome]|uniref:Uncharacterized protein n=1 Tax=hydrothermal vent metagenome TaxID=652676 RepID=A0A3B0WL90_9ZZZZ
MTLIFKDGLNKKINSLCAVFEFPVFISLMNTGNAADETF